MATLLRSIGFKIFGFAAVLLLLMAAAAVWSGYSQSQVNRQLATLSEVLIPVAFRLEDLQIAVAKQEAVLFRAVHLDEDVSLLEEEYRTHAKVIDALLLKINELIAEGKDMAELERNKAQMARLEPMVAQIRHIDDRHGERVDLLFLALRANGRPAPPVIVALLRDNMAELDRLCEKVGVELEAFVESGSAIVYANEQRALYANFVLIGVATIVGLTLALVMSRGLVVPLRRLRERAQAIEDGKLDGELMQASADEIGDLTRAFNHMVGELKAKERIKETFGQFVDPRVISGLIDADHATGGEKQIVTVFFSDIVGFATLSERLTPGGLVRLINEYFTAMSKPIRAHGGIIDKFIGDSVMAFWAPPFVEPSRQATVACASALEQFEQLAAFRKRLPELMGIRHGVPPIDMRIGLASGDAIVGSIGAEFARGFTVMGDTVNLGSRLEGANKSYGTRILIDATTRDMAGDTIEVREIDLITVVGKTEAVRVYELLALEGQLDPVTRELRGQFAIGLEHYRAGRWAEAESGFRASLDIRADDKPSQVMLSRVAQLAANPPAEWDGVWRLSSK